jgi:hypothetical protein
MITEQETYYDVAETAKFIRKDLARSFPGIKFRVHSERYAGGASIDVDWILGPTSIEVDNVVGVYQSRSFDGMIDMAVGYCHWMAPDGTVSIRSSPGTEGSKGVIPAENNPPPPGAKPVHFGSHYVSTQRKYGVDFEAETKLRELVAFNLCQLQKIAYVGGNTRNLLGGFDSETINNHVWRLLNHTSFKAGEEYAGVRFATEEEMLQEEYYPRPTFIIIKRTTYGK